VAAATKLIASKPTFAELTLEERKAISATMAVNESLGDELDEIDWGWFGSMRGAGGFKKVVKNNNPYLSEALECIPLIGVVTRENYDSFIEKFKLAFAKEKQKGKVPVASRLLAIRRPDYFVCVNKMNRQWLCKDLGIAPSTLAFDNYWDDVVVPVTACKWWRQPRPSGAAGAIWDCRVAILDCLYYDPSKH
jgi:hypothetical protein